MPKYFLEKVAELRKLINHQLNLLIDNDYIYIDLPYHSNIGDSLIWKGTEEYLKTLPYKCLYRASSGTYVKPKISNNVVVILHGGGNFGDLYRKHSIFRLQIVKDFPENKIIILPQTVFYKNIYTLKQDAHIMEKHSNLTICARDYVSHQLLKTHFPTNNILLLPDMAFCISQGFLNQYKKSEQNKAIFIKRKDKEYVKFNYEKYLNNQQNIETHDWPSVENVLFISTVLYLLQGLNLIFHGFKYMNRLSGKIIDWYAINIYMPRLVKIGVQFMSGYKYVYTTRLHGAILSLLLKKTVTIFDNSYGKNFSFYNSWLRNVEGITFVELLHYKYYESHESINYSSLL